jgi:hypothetical protein
MAFIVRMVLFILVVYFSINYFSRSQAVVNIPTPNILGTTYQYLPPSSRQTLENLHTSPAATYIQTQFNFIKGQLGDFPQKQITELKKLVVETVYQNIMNSLDTKK